MCRGAADKKTTHCGCDGAQRGARGAHLPYLENDMGNSWVKKFDLYLLSRGMGGFRAVWMMFERSEGVVAVAFRAMEVVAGRGGSPLAFRATEGGKVAGSCRLSVTVSVWKSGYETGKKTVTGLDRNQPRLQLVKTGKDRETRSG